MINGAVDSIYSFYCEYNIHVADEERCLISGGGGGGGGGWGDV